MGVKRLLSPNYTETLYSTKEKSESSNSQMTNIIIKTTSTSINGSYTIEIHFVTV